MSEATLLDPDALHEPTYTAPGDCRTTPAFRATCTCGWVATGSIQRDTVLAFGRHLVDVFAATRSAPKLSPAESSSTNPSPSPVLSTDATSTVLYLVSEEDGYDGFRIDALFSDETAAQLRALELDEAGRGVDFGVVTKLRLDEIHHPF